MDYSVLQAGLAVTPAILVAAAVAGPTSRLAQRIGHRPVLVAGGLIWGVGLLWLVERVGATPNYLGVWLPGIVIVGIGYGAIGFGDILDLVAARLDRAPQLRQRIQPIPGHLAPPVWVDDGQFDVRRHVMRAAPRGAVSIAQFAHLTSLFMRLPLDLRHPPWRVYVVERLEDDGLGLVIAIHHVIGDALAALALFGSKILFDVAPDAPRPESSPREADVASAALVGDAELIAAAERYRAEARRARARRIVEVVRPGAVGETARTAIRASLLIRKGRASRVGPAPFARQPSNKPEVAFLGRSLSRLKLAGRAIVPAATFNDLAIAAVVLGLEPWLDRLGQHMDTVRIRIPVSVRATAARYDTGEPDNRVAPVHVSLPLSHRDPAELVRSVHQATNALKEHGEAEVSAAIDEAVWLLPQRRAFRAMRWLAEEVRTFHVVVTNFPGPQIPVYTLRARLVDAFPSHSLTGGVGLSVAITSVEDHACFGIVCDAEAHSDLLRDEIEAALDEIQNAAERQLAIRSIPIFSPLPEALKAELARHLESIEYEPGQAICREGEEGDSFYVVRSGRLEVAIGGTVERILAPGDSFGEIALLSDRPRTATVTAKTPASVFALERAKFVPAVTGDRESRTIGEAIIDTRLGWLQ